jgi:peptidoglycan/xylan/chitin deacetylase (PgdA/CDA1 family)
VIGRLRAAARRALGPSFETLLRRQRGLWLGTPTFALSFDVETSADCRALPEVVSLLRERRLAASFACIGTLVERYPDEHRALVTDTHELLNHTDTHPWHDELGVRGRFDALDDAGLDREIEGGQRKISRLGVAPVGFRAPHFGAQFTPRMYGALKRAGLRYSTSTSAHRTASGGAPFRVDGLVEIPLLVCPEHPDSLLDSWHCTSAPDAAHTAAADLVAVHRQALDAILRHGAFGAVYWDPRVLAAPGYREVLDEIATRLGSVRLADVFAAVAS